ncbi:MAG: acetyl-/propionyl-CoA carboxylase subunit alpha, partial [Gammaproteobacteria bacterium]|nr:acetyl-/propionyl-CoA carboxylase subunit alpha [Gammaproteobacteria bacterium]
MFNNVLIANRGEIAVRIARSVRDAGLQCIAVFSDADRDARHVAAADRAVALGGSSAAESYLNIDKLLDAA